MARTKVREQPKLLVDIDLSKQVREDLRIAAPVLTPNIKAGPQISAGPSISAGPAVRMVNTSAVTVSNVHTHRPINTHRPPAPLVRAIAAKIRSVLPPDGDVCFSLTHEYPGRVGEVYDNWAESPFWLASDYQVLQAVYEWMNSEYEAILDMMAYDERDHIAAPGYYGDEVLGPTIEELCEAWDYVANDMEGTVFLIQVYSREGIEIGYAEVSAGWLMGQLGYTKEAIIPTVVVARTLNPADLDALNRDDEVMLDKGYVITEVASSDDYTTCYIEPK